MSRHESHVLWQRVAAAACGLALALSSWAQDAPVLAGIVTAVMEGDTIKVQLSTGPTIVKLANIDAPEFKQPGGAEARKALHERIVTEHVSLHVTRKEGDEPMAAVVYLGGENINGWMVKQGYAWAHRQEADAPDYCVWENGARSLKRGIWAQEESLAPWEWRQGGKGKAVFYTDYRKASAASCIAEMQRR